MWGLLGFLYGLPKGLGLLQPYRGILLRLRPPETTWTLAGWGLDLGLCINFRTLSLSHGGIPAPWHLRVHQNWVGPSLPTEVTDDVAQHNRSHSRSPTSLPTSWLLLVLGRTKPAVMTRCQKVPARRKNQRIRKAPHQSMTRTSGFNDAPMARWCKNLCGEFEAF